MRFSLRMLLVTFVVVAVCCAGLRYPNSFVGSLFTTLAFVTVMVSALLAVFCRGNRRSFWIGFAMFGGIYFAMATYGERGPDPVMRVLRAGGGPVSEALSAPRLVTTRLLVLADSYMQSVRDSTANPPGAVSTLVGLGMIVGHGDKLTIAFIDVGQAIFTLIFALIGGWLGSRYGRPVTSE